MITICIATMPERREKLLRMLARLRPQLSGHGLPEPLVYETPSTKDGGATIGAKRQTMLEAVTTQYVAFVDDDDMVSTTYGAHLKHLCETGLDGMGFRGIMTTNSKHPVEFVHSHRYTWMDKPVQAEGSLRYIRPLNHLNPVKTAIALQIGYKDMIFGEDRDYADRLKASGLVKSEYFTDEFIYNYDYKSRK